MDGHAWYDEGFEYVYSVPETFADLAGKTVSGTVSISAFALVCKTPNCPHDASTPIEIHHHGVKVEQGGEDYWLAQSITGPDAGPLPDSLRGPNRVAFSLDTTQLTNGLHVLSHHAHAIDGRAISHMRGRQLATETKIVVNVQNSAP